ncbi:monocarboxylate transporter 14-like [Haliotis rubra]|uniref:monocarboxylate transporter 14-like n=1 Tax=Haliotis rubra TaxID=36100 RepID=UPI001EE5E065|nr:monocarboxylate transporter 14-like [Haliotis rubra]
MSKGKEGDHNGKVGNSETHHPDEDNNLLPIDRGWAWAILGGCFLNAMLMGGYNRSMALFFVEYLEMFGASTTKTTLILGMVFSKGSQMDGQCTMIAFAKLQGMGNSMIHAPALVLIGKYFKKRRGLATTAARVASQFIMFYTTYPLLVAYCVVVGVFGCAFPCLLPLVIVDFMGVDCALRDLTGSYLPCFQYLGATSLLAAAQLLCEPLVRHYTAKTTEGSPSKDEECLEPLK